MRWKSRLETCLTFCLFDFKFKFMSRRERRDFYLMRFLSKSAWALIALRNHALVKGKSF